MGRWALLPPPDGMAGWTMGHPPSARLSLRMPLSIFFGRNMPSLKEILAGLPLMEPATNKGNNATNTEIVATNAAVAEPRCGVSAPKPDVGKSANRRDREDYNAYQREYMRKRRAK